MLLFLSVAEICSSCLSIPGERQKAMESSESNKDDQRHGVGFNESFDKKPHTYM